MRPAIAMLAVLLASCAFERTDSLAPDAAVDAPAIDAPVDAPALDAPDIDAPDIDAPIDAPDAPVDAPDIDAPDIDAPPGTVRLTVTLTGNGSGTVTGTGIDCPGTDCTEDVSPGTTVTLTAVPTAPATFTGWSGGGCSGTGMCTVTVNAATTVSANFALPLYALTVVKAGAGGGTVTSNPAGINCGALCTTNFSVGTMVTLTAAPNATSTFNGWSGAGCAGTGTCTVIMNQAHTVTATFAIVQFPLTVMKTGSGTGTVTSNPAGINCGADCMESYDLNTMVTLTASPSSNAVFTGWSGGGCSGTGTCIVTVTAADIVTATFAASTLTVMKSGSGTGLVTSTPAGINCGADCSETYNAGTMVTLSTAPTSGSAFTGWSGGGCAGTGPCVVTMSGAVTVTATFVTNTLTVTRAGTGGGSVSSSPTGILCGGDCTETYSAGTVVTLTAVPNASSTFTGWSGGGCSGTGTCIVTMNAPASVTATFTAHTLVITAEPTSTTAGESISTITVEARDPGGNRVTSYTGAITIARDSGPAGAVLSGTTIRNAVGGVASFSDLSLNLAGFYTLAVSATGLTGDTSASFGISPAAASSLQFTVQPSAAIAGVAISPSIEVTARDPFDNTVIGYTGSITIAIGNNPGGSTLSGTTMVNAVGGVATFSNLSLNRAGSGYTLTASATGLSSNTSSSFSVSAAAPVSLYFVVQPSNIAVNQLFSPTVRVGARDQFGNAATSFSGTVSMTKASGPPSGTLVGTLDVNTMAGEAIFSYLTMTAVGTYTLRASASGLTSATSTSFTVN